MDAIERMLVLQSVSLFSGFVSEELFAIAEELTTEEMLRGDYIFKQGDTGEQMYIICSGAVDIIKNEQTLITLSEYKYFGELSLFDEGSYGATAKCTQDGLLIVVDRASFERIIMEFPRILQVFSSMIVSYLLTSNGNVQNKDNSSHAS